MSRETLLILLCIILLFRIYAIRVVRFYRPGCPACEATKEAWRDFKLYNIWNPLIDTITIDTTTESGQKLAAQYGIKLVPTTLKIDGLKIKAKKGRLTLKELNKFVYAM